MQPHIRAAIFDMDGTLLDSMPVYHNLTRGYLAGLGVTVERAELDALEGKTQRQWAEYFCAAYPQIGMTPEAFDAEIDLVPLIRIVVVAPGAPEVDIISAPAIRPWRALSTEYAGAVFRSDIATLETDPVRSAFLTAP